MLVGAFCRSKSLFLFLPSYATFNFECNTTKDRENAGVSSAGERTAFLGFCTAAGLKAKSSLYILILPEVENQASLLRDEELDRTER